MSNNRSIYILAAVLLAAVIATYANHFQNTFHFDDSHAIVNNAYIRNIGNIPLFFLDSTKSTPHPQNQAYRPIVTASTAIDYWLGKGLNPFYFHLSTFTLFLLQGILMYFLYLRIFNLAYRQEWNEYAALFATAWYLLHPANAETINYMLARSDSISTFFVVMACILFLFSSVCRRWHLYLIPLTLGCLTKPTAVMFGPLLFVYVLLFEAKTDLTGFFSRQNVVKFSASLKKTMPAIVLCVVGFVFIKSMDSPTVFYGGGFNANYSITQPYVMLQYFLAFFLPVSLSADTDLAQITTILDIRFFAGMAFVLALIYAGLIMSKKEKFYPISFGIFWFFIALIPTSTVVPLAEVMNDHRVFFPYVGLMMAVVWAAVLLLFKFKEALPVPLFGRAVVLGAVIVLASYAYGTRQRNEVWRTGETLWRDVTVKSPKNGRGWMNYGLTQMAKGAYPAAESAFLKALEFTPNYSSLFINFGVLKAAMGRPAEAESYFVKALKHNEEVQPNPYSYYGRFLVQQKRWQEAVPLLLKAVSLAPADLFTRHTLMTAYDQGNKVAELGELAEEMLRIDPNDFVSKSVLAALVARNANPSQPQYGSVLEQTPEALLNLSLQYYRAGDFKGCIQVAEAALLLRPDYAQAYNNICAAWNSLGEWDKAVPPGERAVALDPGSELARNNLALAKSRVGLKH